MQPHLARIFRNYPQAIDAMPNNFNSHQFILTLARQNQGDYIRALHVYREKTAPFKSLHALLAKLLSKCPTQVRKGRQEVSLDIFNEPERCTTWSKV